MTVSLSLIHQHFLIYTIIPKTRETEFLRMCFRILKTDCGFQHRYILNFSKIEKDTKELKGILTTLKETTIREDKHPFLEQEIFEPIDRAVDILKEQMEAFSAKVEDFQIDITQRINDKILDLSSQGDEIQDQIDEKFKIGEELTNLRTNDTNIGRWKKKV